MQARLHLSQSAPLCAVASALRKRLLQFRRFIPGSAGPGTSTKYVIGNSFLRERLDRISPDSVARSRSRFPPRRGSASTPVQRAARLRNFRASRGAVFFHDLRHWLVRSVIALAALFSSMVCGTGTPEFGSARCSETRS